MPHGYFGALNKEAELDLSSILDQVNALDKRITALEDQTSGIPKSLKSDLAKLEKALKSLEKQ